MPEWLVEEGIGEHRAIRLSRGRIAEARLHWPGKLAAGTVAEARLVSRASGSKRGTVRFPGGEEALADGLEPSVSEGAGIRCRVTREALRERDRSKLARAVPTDEPLAEAPGLREQLQKSGCEVRVVPRFPEGDWEELWLEAWQGVVPFESGELAFFDTSAMTLVDIDGAGDPRGLSLAVIPALADAIRRFDMGGSIGIDFPTLSAKADRKAVDKALATALADWRHERTAMNGFGFVHIVTRFKRPSLLQRIRQSRRGAAARLLLRRSEAVKEPGALLLTMHPALRSHITQTREAELVRRTGREIRYATDPGLALDGGFAQAVPV